MGLSSRFQDYFHYSYSRGYLIFCCHTVAKNADSNSGNILQIIYIISDITAIFNTSSKIDQIKGSRQGWQEPCFVFERNDQFDKLELAYFCIVILFPQLHWQGLFIAQVSLIKEYALLQFGQRNTLEVKTSYQMTNKIRAIKSQ